MTTKTLKGVSFSNVPVGSKFFQQKNSDPKLSWIKEESVKTEKGWSNAKNSLGMKAFIKYDARVWIES